ncbi:MAG: beta-galactosidase [Patescibacteria group bacterium]
MQKNKQKPNSKIKERIIVSLVFFAMIFILVVSLFTVLFFYDFGKGKDFVLGVNFSRSYADYLGVDPRETLFDILNELKVKHVRLSVPWNEVEKENGVYDFSDLDWQIEFAEQFGAKVILTVGRRTPHWPECHDPEWLKNSDSDLIREKQLAMIKAVVENYKNREIIEMWQVENEPMLDYFGECPPANYDLLREEISLVKTLDIRPILITDSGELSSWLPASKAGDSFGTTMYRVVQNDFLGYIYYHLPPIFYNWKARILGLNLNDVLVAELQAEPWAPNGILNSALSEQFKSMDAKRLKSHVVYARKTGFRGAYLWGAEWWYYLAKIKGNNSLWETAKTFWEK